MNRRVLPLADFLATYSNVYGQPNWDAMLASFLLDKVQAETIRLLVRELASHQFFRRPIVVGEAEDDDERRYLAVLDGTHRVCAYLLAGVTEVEVEDAGDNETVVEDEPFVWVETHLSGPESILVDPVGWSKEDASAGLWEVLVSLPVDGDHWIVSDTGSWRADEGEVRMVVCWDEEADGVPENLITECVRARLLDYGYDVSRLSIETVRVVES